MDNNNNGPEEQFRLARLIIVGETMVRSAVDTARDTRERAQQAERDASALWAAYERADMKRMAMMLNWALHASALTRSICGLRSKVRRRTLRVEAARAMAKSASERAERYYARASRATAESEARRAVADTARQSTVLFLDDITRHMDRLRDLRSHEPRAA